MANARNTPSIAVKKTRATRAEPLETAAIRRSPRSNKITKSVVKVPEVRKVSAPNGATPTLLSRKKTITEADILGSKQAGQLVGYINSLIGTDQDRVFSEYKRETAAQITRDAQLILQLVEDNQDKDNVIKELQKEMAALRKAESKAGRNPTSTPLKSSKKPDLLFDSASVSVYESPIKRKKDSKLNERALINEHDISQELKTIGITLDMLELLAGLRIVDYEEDRTKLHFDVKQVSTVGSEDGVAAANIKLITIHYRLVISKKFASTGEVKYVPKFLSHLEELEDDGELRSMATLLNKYLPDYFCDNLTFPYSTLSQFYIKMNKALNKIAKKK